MTPNPDYSTWFTKQAAADTIGVSLKTMQNLGNLNKVTSHLWRNPAGGPLMRVYAPDDVHRLAAARHDAGSPRFGHGPDVPPNLMPFLSPQPATLGLAIPATGAPTPLGNYLEVMATTQKEIAGQHTASMITAQQLASKLCLTIPEAAEFAGVSKKLIHTSCVDGTLDAFQDGRVWRIPRARLVARYGSP
jgi:hypothetical protein